MTVTSGFYDLCLFSVYKEGEVGVVTGATHTHAHTLHTYTKIGRRA